MVNPDDISMATLLAEDGMPVSAGLPEAMRRDLVRLNVARRQFEQARSKRERLEQLIAEIAEHEAQIEKLQDALRVAEIAEHEAQIVELQKELPRAVREYLDATSGAPAA
jgi:SMC interacting uncharacterized protein involved in chromosome segregation